MCKCCTPCGTLSRMAESAPVRERVSACRGSSIKSNPPEPFAHAHGSRHHVCVLHSRWHAQPYGAVCPIEKEGVCLLRGEHQGISPEPFARAHGSRHHVCVLHSRWHAQPYGAVCPRERVSACREARIKVLVLSRVRRVAGWGLSLYLLRHTN